MADKLNTGDTFPTLALTVSDGSTLRVPDGLGSGYRIILFYRGHW
jgi:peroxiredoxin